MALPGVYQDRDLCLLHVLWSSDGRDQEPLTLWARWEEPRLLSDDWCLETILPLGQNHLAVKVGGRFT